MRCAWIAAGCLLLVLLMPAATWAQTRVLRPEVQEHFARLMTSANENALGPGRRVKSISILRRSASLEVSDRLGVVHTVVLEDARTTSAPIRSRYFGVIAPGSAGDLGSRLVPVLDEVFVNDPFAEPLSGHVYGFARLALAGLVVLVIASWACATLIRARPSDQAPNAQEQ